MAQVDPYDADPPSSNGNAGDGAANSHPACVAKLFREHNAALIRFLQRRLRSEQEAREVAQEAYVRLLRLDRPQAVAFLRAFLYKTAANLAVDRIRSRVREHARDQDMALFEEFREVPTPDREVSGREDLAKLQTLIGELPPKCQRAFRLLKFDGLDYPEIAQQMELSERMVRVYVVRALLHCRIGLGKLHTRRERAP